MHFQMSRRQQKGGNLYDGAPVFDTSLYNGPFPCRLSCDKYCNPGYCAMVTAQCQSELLVIFFREPEKNDCNLHKQAHPQLQSV